jgi:hypothetical protein
MVAGMHDSGRTASLLEPDLASMDFDSGGWCMPKVTDFNAYSSVLPVNYRAFREKIGALAHLQCLLRGFGGSFALQGEIIGGFGLISRLTDQISHLFGLRFGLVRLGFGSVGLFSGGLDELSGLLPTGMQFLPLSPRVMRVDNHRESRDDSSQGSASAMVAVQAKPYTGYPRLEGCVCLLFGCARVCLSLLTPGCALGVCSDPGLWRSEWRLGIAAGVCCVLFTTAAFNLIDHAIDLLDTNTVTQEYLLQALISVIQLFPWQTSSAPTSRSRS